MTRVLVAYASKHGSTAEIAQAISEELTRQELEVDLAPGSYEYICDIHPNMVGTLTVEAANPP